ncbi:MAG TPA: hypothetical protein VIJ94_06340 [Caulobacteraceae bacterium]
MQQPSNPSAHGRGEQDPPPAAERGRLKGAPLDGVTADNPAHPKTPAGVRPPRPAER